MAPPLLVVLAAGAQAQNFPYTDYVNLFLGTTNGGNMFPGAVAGPFAMVKLGPDVENGTTDAYSGYLPAGNITGFSMLHESGTGGAPKYGVVNQMPVVGNVSNPLLDLGRNRSAPDQAEVGYYKSTLDSGVTIEVAASDHAGIYQYTFPTSKSNVVVDVSHVLPSFRGLGWGQGYAGGSFNILPNGSYVGYGIYNNGWNLAPNWNIYFCGSFDEPALSSKTFTGNGTTLYSYGGSNSTSGNIRQGGVFSFNTSTVTSRVGVSFISTAKACQNVKQEVPSGCSLQSLVSASQTRWTEEVFSKVQTTETNTTVLTQLYSYLYGMHLLPSNRTGENPLWVSSEPSYDDIFTYWDLFRCSTALVHVLQPTAYEEQIRSIIDIWRHEGWLPDARSSHYTGRTQGGSSADIILADAFVKGVRGAVNWQDGYKAMKMDAEVTPPNNHDPIAPDSSTKEGRGALPDWLKYGYITPTYSRAVTRAVEYAVDDFGLSQVAAGLGYTDDAATYLNRSRNWRNHWNPHQTSLNFSGFLVPRYANGSFEYPYDPLQCGGCYWPDPYYEALPWEYSFNAHHDMATLIRYSGGNATFIQRLETLFQPGVYAPNAAFGSTIFNPGNEPSFTSPHLFSFANRQDRAVARARHVSKTFYGAGAAGLPGNSDAGAMQTWALWDMLGLYPVTGQTTFLVGSPWFADVSVGGLGAGRDRALRITSVGGDADAAFYVQSLKVNGVPWDRTWVTWGDVFEEGGTMEFVLGDQPVVWATGELPPSPAS
ncbi:hypothetical protein MBLNU459_g4048t1 [Dothideomycetes sp. NU459]